MNPYQSLRQTVRYKLSRESYRLDSAQRRMYASLFSRPRMKGIYLECIVVGQSYV
jgi:hypothetical protein